MKCEHSFFIYDQHGYFSRKIKAKTFSVAASIMVIASKGEITQIFLSCKIDS